jgi:hypothetical protein
VSHADAVRGSVRVAAARWRAAVPAAGRIVSAAVWRATLVLAVALLLLIEGWAAAGVWQYLTHD